MIAGKIAQYTFITTATNAVTHIAMPIKGKPSFTIGKPVIYSPPSFIYLLNNRIKASVATCSYQFLPHYKPFLNGLSMQ